LLAEIRDIHRLNDKLDDKLVDIVVLKAIEVDILEDGKLDLPDSLLRQLAYMRFGVYQARRGWLEPADVINMRPLAALRKLLKRK
jgi:histidinol phosphatase-like PHP family hydrolase